MKRSDFLHMAFGAGALGVLRTNAAEKRPPNIVLILADDLGWADTGCYGNTYHRTPNIDRLAAQGMRFTDAYANAANCAPTRACLLTGRYVPRHGVYTVGPPERFDGHEQFLEYGERKLLACANPEAVPEDAILLPQPLRRAGYATALFGKVHALFRRGHVPHMHRIAAEDVEYIRRKGFDEAVVARSFDHLHASVVTEDGPAHSGELMSEVLSGRAARFIGDHRNRPFFLYLASILPHSPLKAPAERVANYERIPASETHDNPTYAAMVELLDRAVGRVLDALEEHGLAENTLVIFTSDNGGATGVYGKPWTVNGRITSNAPLRGQKGQFYEGGIRVPFIARCPGSIEAGAVCRTPVALTDLYPTFLELAGCGIPGRLDGRSLRPLLESRPERFPERPLFWHFPGYLPLRARPHSVVRRGDYKLIENFEDGSLELYNLREDLSERQNLAPSQPELCAELAALLRDWRRRTGARIPEPNPDFDPADEGVW
ncbi:sulfatase [Kiritimatiella glycovorans]|uniref:Arylsulfatase n=1 Tax=Kiritimatiella glycovorans TaxID=1307763 RepID=A0A0G3EI96_9BACT|nr:sulfatase [Kiritimatiella glycovorans]AKJ65162.1 Arylsulfatase [Kiritimatiella glycovorans]